MTRLTPDVLEKAAAFVWLTGRVLDQRRMAHLRGGDASGVLAALDAYATPDGAYAFGLEPDIKGPEPQPLTAMTALRVLDEIGGDTQRAERLAGWLADRQAPDGGFPALLGTIAAYPRPPWIEAPQRVEGGLLPTGRIVGLLAKHGHLNVSPGLKQAEDFCWAAIEGLATTHPYEVESAVAFLDNVPDRTRAVQAAGRLGTLVRDLGLVLLDPAHPERFRPAPGYADEEFHLAYDFAPSPQSVAVQWFSTEELAVALDHLATAQQEDGGWQITWRRWAPTTESEARPGVTIEKLHILKAWDAEQHA